jgi:hypothetical protein
MTAAQALRATALGLVLATFPYLHWVAEKFAPHHAPAGPGAASHANHGGMKPERHAETHGDHSAHHGGQLGMAGDYHLEFVRRDRNVEIHPSDAIRKPLVAVGGSLDYGDGISHKLRPRDGFLEGPYVAGSESVTAVVELENGDRVEIEFWISDSGS